MSPNELKARIQRRVTMEEPLLKAMGLSQQAFLTIIYNAMAVTPALANCSADSLDKAIMDCLNARLVPDGREAVIVPRRNVATFQIMIDGRMKLAHQATPGLTIRRMVVYRGEHFEYAEGPLPEAGALPVCGRVHRR